MKDSKSWASAMADGRECALEEPILVVGSLRFVGTFGSGCYVDGWKLELGSVLLAHPQGY